MTCLCKVLLMRGQLPTHDKNASVRCMKRQLYDLSRGKMRMPKVGQNK